ncbi:class I SAM-dependent methyltransferase [Paenibacillus chondroitinus]|uniref:Class I SAM-dependent methyltransferase n=1 Tax=Paenibacillus chondroitinus TaxID=59842 RepID=A0ABU6D3L2_9BACL|nr:MULTISPECIES: class I SAM-dependent methyltransferase [Paenibacillus]MCY9660879.1 class I SAM-dependent methyltransferase [Paenibacillus anseongense]MEB4792323.1 class I SAM-dependent methyltransferase [Paenibacillus chondroitinus]
MPNHDEIYKLEAETYDLLISKQPSLQDVIESIHPVEGLDILDLGAGSGRLTRVLAPKAKSILAVDASEAMLQVTAQNLQAAGLHNWSTQVADHRALPVPDNSYDLIVSGWSICYLGSSDMPNWQENIRQVMAEIKRALRPGGCAIIFENFGTGSTVPNPPSFLRAYYDLLENELGMSHTWIRTDYQFDSLEEAERLSRFFFGDELAQQVVQEGWIQLPECAGIWWLR